MKTITESVREKRKRQDWIDALRAIAMILVVYGHLVPGWTEYFVFTSPVKVSMFFAITGYVFNENRNNIRLFFLSIFRKLVIPWLVFGIGPYVIVSFLKGPAYLWGKIQWVITGTGYWYMPCCIIAEIIWFFVHKAVKTPCAVCICTAVLFAIGLLFDHLGVLRIFMINTALISQLYLLIGYLYKKNGVKIANVFKHRMIIIVCGTAVYLGLGILSLVRYPGFLLDIHNNRYYSLPICQAMIWLGIGLLFFIAEHFIKKYPKWLLAVGQNTLVIYIFHGFACSVIRRGMKLAGINQNEIVSAFMTIIAVGVCCLISISVKRVFPFVFGKRKTVS